MQLIEKFNYITVYEVVMTSILCVNYLSYDNEKENPF